jgi:histone H3/H4
MSSSTSASSTAPATTEVSAPATETVSKDSKESKPAKRKGGARGAPKAKENPSHDVKSSGGSSKKARDLKQKTISKPAIYKMFQNDEDPDHAGVRIAKKAIPVIQNHFYEKMQKLNKAMLKPLADEKRHTVHPSDARSAVRSVLPYSKVFA